GPQVAVGGVVIGDIDSDGTGGSDFRVELNSNATAARIEAMMQRLAYANGSDDPSASRQYVAQVTDGDGGSTDSHLLTINVAPEVDLDLTGRGAEQQVNSQAARQQEHSEIAELVDAGGNSVGHVVVWASYQQDRTEDNSWGVYAQIYDLNGSPVGGEFRVNDHTEGSQYQPIVTGLAGGGFAVAWYDDSGAHPDGRPAGETSGGVYARVFGNDGAAAGDSFLVNDLTPGTQSEPALVSDGAGGFMAVWTDHNGRDGSGAGVYARLFSGAGVASGAAVLVNEEISGSQSDPAVIRLDDGTFVVSWTSATSGTAGDGSSNGVFARLLTSGGAVSGGEFQLSQTSAGSQDDSDLAALDDGGFIAIWTTVDNDGSYTAVYSRRFDATGAPAGDEFQVNETTANYQHQSRVAAAPDGGWVAIWTDNSGADGSGTGVFMQRFAADGGRLDGETQVNIQTSSSQSVPDVIVRQDGTVVTGWTSAESAPAGDGDQNGVFQRLFDPAGAEHDSAAPTLAGLPATLALDEADFAGGPRLIAPSATLGDSDSVDFAGGELLIQVLDSDTVQALFKAPDAKGQDQLGLDLSGSVSLDGATVRVDGVAVATLLSDGADGATLRLSLGADATLVRVRELIRALTYENTSDAPEATRELAIRLTDGDGGELAQRIAVTIAPEIDGLERVDEVGLVNSFTSSTQDDPMVAALSDGGYVIVWESYNQDATGDNAYGIFAQLYDASGARVGGEFLVNQTTYSNQLYPAVEGLPGGGFAVVWADHSSQINGLSQNPMMRIFDGFGQPQGGEFVVGDATDRLQDRPAMAAIPVGGAQVAAGGVIVVRRIYDGSEGDYDIVADRYDASGARVGGPIEVTAASTSATSPDVATLLNGSYVIVYNDYGLETLGASDNGVYLQRVAADGSLIGGRVQVNSYEFGNQDAPRVAALDGGGFVVVWNSRGDDALNDGGYYGVRGQLYNADGSRDGEEFLVNGEVTQHQYVNDVVALDG
ncbi:MAG: hypothetical protein VX463_00115, partial [Pseudomonadota bacterium]|nr:hypothetical protein [Pseudomonadota bacterium]